IVSAMLFYIRLPVSTSPINLTYVPAEATRVGHFYFGILGQYHFGVTVNPKELTISLISCYYLELCFLI
ncbi:hypothetical protein KKH43_00495, partial [Patescibacteria group bacterium]|nr:hypothetical protein [Patescibacteria group bacterium]